MAVSGLGRDVQLGAGRVHELQSVDRTAGGQARGHRAGVPTVREVRQNSAGQCCQAENQTKKSQNQTFLRPYFYQISDQKRTQTRYFRGQNQTCSKNLIPILGKSTFI